MEKLMWARGRPPRTGASLKWQTAPLASREAEVMFEAGDVEQERFGGYGRTKGADGRDGEIGAFVEDLVDRGPRAVAVASADVSERGRQVLRTYAVRAARQAKRRKDRALLVHALVASVVAGLDERRPDTHAAMAPIDESAEHLGLRVGELLDETAAIVGPSRTAAMVTCLGRASAERRASARQLAAQRYEAIFDPADPRPDRYSGYGPTPIPNKRDDEITDFINHVIATGPDAVRTAIRRITRMGRDVLAAYAERMATLAARRTDRDVLLRAVIANVIGGLESNSRSALRVMAPIEDSARRIGTDLTRLFADAAAIVGPPGSENLELWLTRKPENRTLQAMHYDTPDDSDGLRYTKRQRHR